MPHSACRVWKSFVAHTPPPPTLLPSTRSGSLCLSSPLIDAATNRHHPKPSNAGLCHASGARWAWHNLFTNLLATKLQMQSWFRVRTHFYLGWLTCCLVSIVLRSQLIFQVISSSFPPFPSSASIFFFEKSLSACPELSWTIRFASCINTQRLPLIHNTADW